MTNTVFPGVEVHKKTSFMCNFLLLQHVVFVFIEGLCDGRQVAVQFLYFRILFR